MNQDHTSLQNENKEDKIKDGHEMLIDDTIEFLYCSNSLNNNQKK